MKGFSVVYRNYGHWDIYITDEGRGFCIRGGPGKYYVRDERPTSAPDYPSKSFKTVQACMSYVCDELMFELIVADGQEPQVIESWNV